MVAAIAASVSPLSTEKIIIICLTLVVLGGAWVIYDMNKRIQERSITASGACPVGPHTPAILLPQPQPASQQLRAPSQTDTVRPNTVQERDYRVIADPLYPPLGRQDAEGTRRLMAEPRLAAHPTQAATNDTFRLVGYMVNQEEKGDSWKLYARSTQGAHRSVADFYAEPASRDMAGVKVPLSGDGTTTPRLRDVYDVPDAISVRHPMFSQSAMYTIVPLPSGDLGSSYI